MKRLNLIITAQLHTRLKVICALQGVEMSEVVRKLIEDYVEKTEKKIKK